MPGWTQHILDAISRIQDETGQVELVLVNDGSVQDIAADVALLQQSVPTLKYIHYATNRGKGYAIRAGAAAASGQYIVYTDVDFPYTHKSFMAVYHALQAGNCDIAVGIKDSHYYDHVPQMRRWISRMLRFMTGKLLRIGITDTQCGLKGLNRNALPLLLQGNIDRYLSDLELICTAERRQMRLLAIPVSLREGVVFSPVKMKILLRELSNFASILRSK